MAAPKRSLLEGRGADWAFSRPTMRVKRARLDDGVVLVSGAAQPRTRDYNSEAPPLCTSVAYADNRPITMVTWDDRTRRNIGEGDWLMRESQPGVFFVGGEGERTAVAHMAPGESFTVVELLDPVDKQPVRQLRIQRKGLQLTITEQDNVQHVCVQKRLPPKKRWWQRRDPSESVDDRFDLPASEPDVQPVPDTEPGPIDDDPVGPVNDSVAARKDLGG
ncbi:MAG: hypothetical protein ACI9MC_000849 [Kiritimatiellia bacterium]